MDSHATMPTLLVVSAYWKQNPMLNFTAHFRITCGDKRHPGNCHILMNGTGGVNSELGGLSVWGFVNSVLQQQFLLYGNVIGLRRH